MAAVPSPVRVAAGVAPAPVSTVAPGWSAAMARTSASPRALPGPATSKVPAGDDGSPGPGTPGRRRAGDQAVGDGVTVTGPPAQPGSPAPGTAGSRPVGTTTRSRSPTAVSSGLSTTDASRSASRRVAADTAAAIRPGSARPAWV